MTMLPVVLVCNRRCSLPHAVCVNKCKQIGRLTSATACCFPSEPPLGRYVEHWQLPSTAADSLACVVTSVVEEAGSATEESDRQARGQRSSKGQG